MSALSLRTNLSTSDSKQKIELEHPKGDQRAQVSASAQAALAPSLAASPQLLVDRVIVPQPEAAFSASFSQEFRNPLTLTFICPGDVVPRFKGEDQKILDEIKDKLVGKPGVTVTVDEAERKIHFRHHMSEVKAIVASEAIESFHCESMPSDDPMQCTIPFGKCILSDEPYDEYAKRIKEMQEKANAFMESRNGVSIQMNSNPQEQIISKMLERYSGICVGENHKAISPKKWLITHMEELRKQGVKTLYLENFCYDTTQKWFDEYFTSPLHAPMPKYLEKRLELFDNQMWLTRSGYGYTELFKAAKQVGLRIVAIDTTISHHAGFTSYHITSEDLRCLALNYVATRIIEQEQKMNPGKFVVLMGSLHMVTSSTNIKIKGIAELLACPSLNIIDHPTDSIEWNVKNAVEGIDSAVTCNLKIASPPRIAQVAMLTR